MPSSAPFMTFVPRARRSRGAQSTDTRVLLAPREGLVQSVNILNLVLYPNEDSTLLHLLIKKILDFVGLFVFARFPLGSSL